jgi:integrase
MTGAAPLRPDVASVRILLEGARALGGPYGTTLELCILTLCLPWEAVAIDVAEIDWSAGCVTVPARGGTRRILHLPPEAIRTIMRIAGTAGGSGQAVTAGRGRPLGHSDVRLDRMQDRLAVAAPRTIELPPWNFHGLRAAATDELVARGCNRRNVDQALGLKAPGSRTVAVGAIRTGHDDFETAAVVIGRWNAVLAERPKMR